MSESPIEIVFDGPPGPEAGRFVEVEQDGRSIKFGEWAQRPDGFWVLRLPDSLKLQLQVAQERRYSRCPKSRTQGFHHWGQPVERWECLDCGIAQVDAELVHTYQDTGGQVEVAIAREREAKPVPMILTCPSCGERHVDRGAFATKPHHTHACQSCGMCWRPAIVATVGVQFLPGFKDPAPSGDAA